MNKGVACVFSFSRERGYFLPSVSGSFSRAKPEKKKQTNKQSPDIWGIFQKLPEKVSKMGYMINYVHVFRAFNSLPRNGDRALIILCICGRAPEGDGKCVCISREKKERE